MNWQQNLSDVLGSYFCDSTVEEGVAELVFTTKDDTEYHRLCLSAFDEGLQATVQGTPQQQAQLVAILRKSNLAAATADDVSAILEEIRTEYLRQYSIARSRVAPTGNVK